MHQEAAAAITSTVAEVSPETAGEVASILVEEHPEHAADIIDYGIILTGGGALLKNLDEHIKNKTGIPVHVAEDPLLSVVKGTGMVLEDIKKYKEVLITP